MTVFPFGRENDTGGSKPENIAGFALSLAGEGRLEDALIEIDRAIILQPDNDLFYSFKASFLTDLRKYGEAMEAVERAISLNWKEPIHHVRKGRLFELQYLYEPSLEEYGVAMSLDPEHREALASKTKLLIGMGRYAQAYYLAKKMTELDPSDPVSHCRLSECYLGLKRYRSALNEIGISLRFDSNHPGSLELKARILRDTGNNREAMQTLVELLTIDRYNPEILEEVIDVLLEETEYETAEKFSRLLVSMVPGGARSHSTLAYILSVMEKYSEAEKEYNRALDIDPENMEAFAGKMMLLSSTGRPEEALRQVDERITENQDSVDLEALKLELLTDTGDNRNMLREVDRLLLKYPSERSLIRKKVNILESMENYCEALKYLNQVISSTGGDQQSYMERVYVLRLLGEPEKALADTETLIAMDPDNELYHMNRLEFLHKVGNYKEALSEVDWFKPDSKLRGRVIIREALATNALYGFERGSAILSKLISRNDDVAMCNFIIEFEKTNKNGLDLDFLRKFKEELCGPK